MTRAQEYERGALAMEDALHSWQKANPQTPVLFRALEPGTMYIAELNDEVIEWYGASAEARELLRLMRKAGGPFSTLHQARAVIETCLTMLPEAADA